MSMVKTVGSGEKKKRTIVEGRQGKRLRWELRESKRKMGAMDGDPEEAMLLLLSFVTVEMVVAVEMGMGAVDEGAEGAFAGVSVVVVWVE